MTGAQRYDEYLCDMKLNVLPLILPLALVALSCNDHDTTEPFFNYQVSGEEGLEDVTVLLRFRTGGRDDKTVQIPKNASIELDGEALPADSTEYMGVYYEVQKRVDSFIGKHRIVYTDPGGKKYTEEFEFVPLQLSTVLPDTLEKSGFTFQFSGLQPDDKLRVIMIDTEFYTNDINELMTVTNGKLTIPDSVLTENVSAGPLYLEFHRETERPVREATEKGGRMMINYKLKRQVVLK